ncbi:hypothetical protein, partial [Janthinobacterium sp. EB271-G4-7A]|uniref:hypothetical protein n=1 Tax=Janthinobacterium sp. EB271-G4-7A TaxID=2775056 RepID=UPI001E3E79C3
DKALCLSAAKKEEYEAFAAFRQPSFSPCFTRHLHASFSKGANYSPALRTPQALFLRQLKGNKPGTAIAYMNTCIDHRGEQLWAWQQHGG